MDPGSSSEIPYYDCFKKMGLKEEDLQAPHTPLVGFISKLVYPKGRISLKVQVEGASMLADFLVVDAPSSHNAIMERTWLHNMEAVSSTRYQKLKFPLENENDGVEVITIKSDQHMAKQCLMVVVPDEAETTQVHMAELDRKAEFEDVGRAPKQKKS